MYLGWLNTNRTTGSLARDHGSLGSPTGDQSSAGMDGYTTGLRRLLWAGGDGTSGTGSSWHPAIVTAVEELTTVREEQPRIYP